MVDTYFSALRVKSQGKKMEIVMPSVSKLSNQNVFR